MLFRYFFRQLSNVKKVSFLKSKGQMVGTRVHNGRKVFCYMYRDIFSEVVFQNDDPDQSLETANFVTGLQNFNAHLEREFRRSF